MGGKSAKSVDDEPKVKAVIKKRLLSGEGKEFKIGNDIHFTLCRNGKEYSCFGIIQDITDESFDISRVNIDNMVLSDGLRVEFKEVKDGIIHHTDNGWC